MLKNGREMPSLIDPTLEANDDEKIIAGGERLDGAVIPAKRHLEEMIATRTLQMPTRSGPASLLGDLFNSNQGRSNRIRRKRTASTGSLGDEIGKNMIDPSLVGEPLESIEADSKEDGGNERVLRREGFKAQGKEESDGTKYSERFTGIEVLVDGRVGTFGTRCGSENEMDEVDPPPSPRVSATSFDSSSSTCGQTTQPIPSLKTD
ncbi:hypothetical protein IE53DRAFT_368256 [Violaceomyces palustris]|uniref:Uncharacterized protein n=1 Tax=Violaceomyces palustris TaxID=1673888 RepID=A0ACD0NZP6_9BASI|nr:hypothetical protein IE53DRAFT_368256 [Violaceomyces palustris]